jgi:protoporphyrinogen oxidase
MTGHDWTMVDRVGQVAVIGAGPAGLTAAFELARRNVATVVYEADDLVGGISRTVQRDGFRFDIGGHRFFTKVPAVQALWHEILSDEDFLVRPRMSRIYYQGKFFDYPLRATNALAGLGPVEAVRCVGSYAWARVRPPADQTTFEGFTAARFGWRLYRTFFKTYTEKVWGVPADELEADFAAQRIKNLSLVTAVLHSLDPRKGRTDVTSLIEEFHYPRLGPGMMWERCRDLVEAQGTKVHLETAVVGLHHGGGRVRQVTVEHDGARTTQPVDHVISSMPMADLIRAMDPPVPPEVAEAAAGLPYRDFLTVALVVPRSAGFPDNWIYVHEPGVDVGRIQNFGSWSPDMVLDDATCLGLEYFVQEGDELWSMADEDLVAKATDELGRLGLLDPGAVRAGYVVRCPKAYPIYDRDYAARVARLRSWLDEHAANVHPVGRNGMHKYNNQDHSMYTAMLTVENLFGARHDIWSVNVEAEYHEETTSS